MYLIDFVSIILIKFYMLLEIKLCEKYLLWIILMDTFKWFFGNTQISLHQKTEINLPDEFNEINEFDMP